jgi:hypothetical protein
MLRPSLPKLKQIAAACRSEQSRPIFSVPFAPAKGSAGAAPLGSKGVDLDLRSCEGFSNHNHV